MTFFMCFAIKVLLYYMASATIALSLSSYTDKLALLALKEKLTNSVPDSLPSWNESSHFCEWQGVTCGHRHMRVSILHLENQTWGGTLGPSLGNLTFLQILKLKNLTLHGEIPAEIGRLKRLQVLILSNNKLEGEIPVELSNCTNIEEVYLLKNRLIGKVPTWFGSMKQLSFLNLKTNNLVGTIPSSLENVSSLQMLSLTENHLKGTIPYSIGKMSNLKLLYLASNNFSGEIPHSLYNLSNIQYLDLGENDLSGSLPSNLGHIFPNLVELLVGDNHITGNFPTSISNLTGLERIDIGRNSLHGPIPNTLGRLNKLYSFLISKNNFGSGRAHDLDFLSSLSNCTELSTLCFEFNRFGGELPDLIGNFSTNLIWLDMTSNQIYGVIPKRIEQLTSLTFLCLGNNLFQGTIPDSIGKLTNLVILVLQNNKLSGNIPTSIGNLTVLSYLYLHDNELEGCIPFTLRYCTQMQKLSICDNKLSGEIPNQTFGYLKGLTDLFLYNNLLTGSIPSDFSNLKQLSVLHLYSNKFSGAIPLFLSSLGSVEFIDISDNNFSSTIPLQLENMTFLNMLNLSFNNLYGEVPIGGVFSNVTKFSLIGNKNLCGGIPQLKLPACFMLPIKKHRKFLKKKLIFICVFGGIFISLLALTTVHFLTRKTKKLSSSPSLQNRSMRVTYGELYEATNGFSSSNLVGTGSFGSVYKGSLLNIERPIAVKVLNLETRGAAKSFVAECKTLGKMKHRNLVKILTCCSSVDYNGEDFKAIVFEFMPNGSLEKLLHDTEGSENHSLSLKQRVDIALDVAYALDNLHHDEDQVVVHCDVKPNNVLLDDDVVAHLGDFGLARLICGYSSKDQIISSTIKGTIGYIPPRKVIYN